MSNAYPPWVDEITDESDREAVKAAFKRRAWAKEHGVPPLMPCSLPQGKRVDSFCEECDHVVIAHEADGFCSVCRAVNMIAAVI